MASIYKGACLPVCLSLTVGSLDTKLRMNAEISEISVITGATCYSFTRVKANYSSTNYH